MFSISLIEVALHYIIAKLSWVWEQVLRLYTCLASVLVTRLEMFLSFSEMEYGTFKQKMLLPDHQVTHLSLVPYPKSDNFLLNIVLRSFIQPATWQYLEEQFPPSCFRRSFFLLNKQADPSKIQPNPSMHTYNLALLANLTLDLFHPRCPSTKYAGIGESSSSFQQLCKCILHFFCIYCKQTKHQFQLEYSFVANA